MAKKLVNTTVKLGQGTLLPEAVDPFLYGKADYVVWPLRYAGDTWLDVLKARYMELSNRHPTIIAIAGGSYGGDAMIIGMVTSSQYATFFKVDYFGLSFTIVQLWAGTWSVRTL